MVSKGERAIAATLELPNMGKPNVSLDLIKYFKNEFQIRTWMKPRLKNMIIHLKTILIF
jgi:hypothetical protein